MSEEENKDLGDKAKEFADEAKESAKEFAEDVKETFSPENPDSGKTIAIIAHITIIGWIIAIIMNNNNKSEIASYYLRQTLGIFLLALVLGIIPLVGCFAAIISLVLLIISFISAINGEMKPIPIFGTLFQDWFKFI